jgi:hypothetical protein
MPSLELNTCQREAAGRQSNARTGHQFRLRSPPESAGRPRSVSRAASCGLAADGTVQGSARAVALMTAPAPPNAARVPGDKVPCQAARGRPCRAGGVPIGSPGADTVSRIALYSFAGPAANRTHSHGSRPVCSFWHLFGSAGSTGAPFEASPTVKRHHWLDRAKRPAESFVSPLAHSCIPDYQAS